MALFGKNPNETAYTGGKKHWADVIKNTGPGELLIWRQPEEDFNTNSTLIVMPGEEAIFIKGGNIEEVFGNGTYKLSTENYPFISRLRNAFTGGISTFRSSVVINKNAKNSKSAVSCQSLMLDSISRSDTIPAMDIRTKDAAVGHEAKIGSISDDAVFYLMSRGMSEEDAKALIVSGFADNVSKELPLEYAVEMNNLIRLEMKGSIG